MLLFGALLALLAAPQVEKEVKHPITGQFKGEIKDPVKKDVLMRVALQAPSVLPEKKTLGLIVLHHGMNGNEMNYFPGTVDCAKRLGLTEQYVIIAGKSRGAGWAPADDEYELRLIAWAKDTYPIDPRRVYIWGSSNGAAHVGRFGWHHQDLFAAVVGYCGSYNSLSEPPACYKGKPPAPGTPDVSKTEWYFVHGGDDSPENSARACEQLKQKGYRYVFRKLDGYGHTDIWDGNGHPDKVLVDAVRDDWFLWMHSLRHKEIQPTSDEKKALQAALGKVKTEKPEGATVLVNEASRVGGAHGAKVVNGALDSTDAEVRRIAAATAERTLYGREIVLELAKLLKDKSDGVKNAAFKGLGSAANYRYAEAQDVLMRAARSKTAPVDDRVQAIEALGRVVKLMIPGNFEDKMVPWTLVLLLDDDELKVREAAFACFKGMMKDTFEYKPDGATTERKAAMTKWRSWVTQKCGTQEQAAAAK
jgi:pimeloyl-ACP methyl ester carboxylesterase